MTRIIKILVLIVALVYTISPVDFVVGPIDDIIVMLLGIISQKYISVKK